MLSPAPLPGTLRLQRTLTGCALGATTDLGGPVLAWVAVLNYIEHVLKVHVGHTREPMHKTLNVWCAAGHIAHGVKKAAKEDLHLPRAAERGCKLESCCIKRCI